MNRKQPENRRINKATLDLLRPFSLSLSLNRAGSIRLTAEQGEKSKKRGREQFLNCAN